MHFDVFAQGKSVLHSLDPRVKILTYIPLVFVIALLQNIPAAIYYLTLAIIFIIVASINLKELLNRIVALNIFIALLWLTLPFNIEGKTLFVIKTFSFSLDGAIYAFIITLKANAILLFTIALIGTTDVFSLAHALFHLKFPKKLVYLSMFLYRYISVLHEEYERLMHAAKARSFYPKTNISTLKTYAYMVGMLFINSYERSQRIYQALTLRGFRGDFPMLTHFHFHRIDILYAIFMSLIILTRFVLWN
ncbi:MAG: cobalt ECF transporter T component CbiQ [Candidatus Omnitrophica bacterium]|nr:cobalt ECF transporter T component CbiQ [Candidatus Omnitrophota bacterium]